MRNDLIQLVYLVAAIGFALSLKWMSSAPTARRGIFAGEAAFALAIVATLFHEGITGEGYGLIAASMLIGAAIGVPLGLKVPMTAMPQRIALSHAFGALAAVFSDKIKDTVTERFALAWVSIGAVAAAGRVVYLGQISDTALFVSTGLAAYVIAVARKYAYR